MSPARVAASSNPLRDPRDKRLPRIAGPCSMVLFGVTGDLARKKLMPAIYDLANRGLLPPGFSLVGFARRDWADQDFGKIVYESVRERARTPFREEVWRSLAEGIRFVPGSFDDDARLRPAGPDGRSSSTSSAAPAATTRSTCRSRRRRSPRSASSSSAPACRPRTRGRGAGSSSRSRSATTSTSARELNAIVEKVFPADSVFRIDHYLGKETVQNLLALRFANQMFEPVWNANYVDHVQITMAEDIGIGGRAGYYDGIGAARDVIQNHLLQLLALTAMEEPVSFDAHGPPAGEGEGALGGAHPRGPRQGHGPRAVRQGVAGRRGGRRLPRGGGRRARARAPRRTPRCGSTSTPAAGRACRSTCAPANASASGSPRSPWCSSGRRTCRSRNTATEELGQNAIVIRVQPDEGVTLRFGAKVPGAQMEVRDVTMDFGYGRAFTESSPEAYERLILDVLLGEPPLFPRHEEVELSWQILDPIEEFWAKKGGAPEQYHVGRLGTRRRRRDDAPRRTRVEAAVIVDLPSTTTADVAKRLIRLRADTGSMALSRVLTLSSSSTSPRPTPPSTPPTTRAGSTRAGSSSSSRATSAARPGSTARSGSAATPARPRSSCCASTGRSPRTAGRS